MKVTKLVKDSKNVLVEKEKLKGSRKEMYDRLGKSDAPRDFIESWADHIEKRHLINNFTIVANEKLYNYLPEETNIFLPFSEYNGDHSMNWIICWNEEKKAEVFRQNIRLVNFIQWMLP